MSDLPPKVTSLFGNAVPTAETSSVISDIATLAAERMRERKYVAVGVVMIDEMGAPHMLFASEALRDTALLGGISQFLWQMNKDLEQSMGCSTPPKQEPSA